MHSVRAVGSSAAFRTQIVVSATLVRLLRALRDRVSRVCTMHSFAEVAHSGRLLLRKTVPDSSLLRASAAG